MFQEPCTFTCFGVAEFFLPFNSKGQRKTTTNGSNILYLPSFEIDGRAQICPNGCKGSNDAIDEWPLAAMLIAAKLSSSVPNILAWKGLQGARLLISATSEEYDSDRMARMVCELPTLSINQSPACLSWTRVFTKCVCNIQAGGAQFCSLALQCWRVSLGLGFYSSLCVLSALGLASRAWKRALFTCFHPSLIWWLRAFMFQCVHTDTG